jgi:energy-converting hydrogenase Eha subunit G
MRAQSGWLGIATGVSIGVLAWVVGLGSFLWPEHPQWALCFIVAGVAAVSAVILERNERREIDRAQQN